MLPGEVVEIEVDSLLVVLVQLEGDTPSAVHIVGNVHRTVKLLPLLSEVDVTDSVPDEVVGGLLMVALGGNGHSLRGLVAEVDLQGCAALPLLR